MFNIRNLVSRISQTRDGDGSDNGSVKGRSESQSSNVFTEDHVEAEGFLCPSCMEAFPSPDDLQTHYETSHLEPGANYLCPVCRARLNTASELESHFSENHSASASSKHDDLDSLKKELAKTSSDLNEERWNSEELKKEIQQLQKMMKAHNTSEENAMYQQQLQGLQETKSLLTSEVVLLRKQLAEALESMLNLRQAKEKLEEKTARNAQIVVQLQASLDENTGVTAALKENTQQLEAQLEQRASLDDAEMLKRELASVQRMMDQMTLTKEKERDALKTNLVELQNEHEILKNELNELLDVHSNNKELLKNGEQLKQELKLQLEKTEEMKKNFAEKSEQLITLQRMREETDICVGQLRQEVTSLQEMLNQERHAAEGQVSAKEDELSHFKLQLNTHQKQVDELELLNHCLQNSNQELSTTVNLIEKEIAEKRQEADQMDAKVDQLEETITRLKSERAELMLTVERGEGSSTIIHQLQEENVRLQKELADEKICIISTENQHMLKKEEWLSMEKQLTEKRTQLEQSLSNSTKELSEAHQMQFELRQTLDQSLKEQSEFKIQFKSKMEASNVQFKEEQAQLERSLINLSDELEEARQMQSKLQQELNQSKKEQSEWKSKVEANEVQFRGERRQLELSLTSLSTELEESRHLQSDLRREIADLQEKTSEWDRKTHELQTKAQQLEEETKDQVAEIKKRAGDISKLQEELSTVRLELSAKELEKDQLVGKVRQQTEMADSFMKSNQELEDKVENLKKTHQEQLNDWIQEQALSQKDFAEKENLLHQLQQQVQQLQSFPEALEEEKQKHIKSKAEWAEQEELLLAEKESMSIMSTHLKQRLEELQEEYRIQQQILQTETDGLVQQKLQLTEDLNAEKESHRSDKETWSESKTCLEQEAAELRSKLLNVEHSLGQKNQRCLELNTISEKYLTQKIELETRLTLAGEEKHALHNSCSQWETEVDRLKFNAVELRRRLEDSQAALHELGRENQSLQMENAKLQGRKWADDSEVGDCHGCQRDFTLTVRKHHCRNCGQIFCNECSSKSTSVGNSRKPLRVCESCFKELNSSR